MMTMICRSRYRCRRVEDGKGRHLLPFGIILLARARVRKCAKTRRMPSFPVLIAIRRFRTGDSRVWIAGVALAGQHQPIRHSGAVAVERHNVAAPVVAPVGARFGHTRVLSSSLDRTGGRRKGGLTSPRPSVRGHCFCGQGRGQRSGSPAIASAASVSECRGKAAVVRTGRGTPPCR